LTVELYAGLAGGTRPAKVSPPERAPARAPKPQPVKPAAVLPPLVPRRAVVDGVRLATEEDIRARIERIERELAAAAPPAEPETSAVVAAAPPPAAAAPPPIEAAEATGPGTGAPGGETTIGPATGFGGSGIVTYRVMPFDGGYRPDTPGFTGRILGQVSVRGTGEEAFYGRIHLFRAHDFYRDYSDRSLFGYAFRHELGDGAVRHFHTGRVQTHGAYLMVTDLFSNGRISTMSHTVVLAFPRQPAGKFLYDVVEDPSGDFRLRGPNGSSLVFDARNGDLRQARGFVVAPLGATGVPPRVAYRGLHVLIQSVGGNPFLRGRGARVIDARGAECALTTSDLFAYPGKRRESDMFRFASDRDFFSFLDRRCPWLELPRPAETQVAATTASPKPRAEPANTGGLIPSLFGGSAR
ncbi:MAG: hypothetical protein ACREQY_04110, partial [Candidatus Binatia bacterium]